MWQRILLVSPFCVCWIGVGRGLDNGKHLGDGAMWRYKYNTAAATNTPIERHSDGMIFAKSKVPVVGNSGGLPLSRRWNEWNGWVANGTRFMPTLICVALLCRPHTGPGQDAGGWGGWVMLQSRTNDHSIRREAVEQKYRMYRTYKPKPEVPSQRPTTKRRARSGLDYMSAEIFDIFFSFFHIFDLTQQSAKDISLI